jgi:small subunit ribosomal protein S20
MRTSAKERMRNRAMRTRLRAAIKEVKTETEKEAAVKKLREATQIIDKAASKGLIHKKNADRSKSRLTILVNKLG